MATEINNEKKVPLEDDGSKNMDGGGESLMDWDAAGVVETKVEKPKTLDVKTERVSVDGEDVLLRSSKELRDDVLAKALGEESDMRVDRLEKWRKKISKSPIDAKTWAERTRGVRSWKSYRESDLANKKDDEVSELVDERNKQVESLADSYAWLAKEGKKALEEGDMETVVAMMRTELGGVDSIKNRVVEGAEKLQKEKGTEAVVGLLPFYEQLQGNDEQLPAMERMIRLMEPAVGREIWDQEMVEMSARDRRWQFSGELSPYLAIDVLSNKHDALGSPSMVNFVEPGGKYMSAVMEILNGTQARKMALGEVMARVLTSDEALNEVTKTSVLKVTDENREMTTEEQGKVAEMLRLRLLGYMEAAITKKDGVLEGLEAHQRQNMDTTIGKPMIKMMESLTGDNQTAWQMIHKDTGEMADKVRELLGKIGEKDSGLIGSIKQGLESSHNNKMEEKSKKEAEARAKQQVEDDRKVAESQVEIDRLVQEKVLEGFVDKMLDGDNRDGMIGVIKQIRFSTNMEKLRATAENAKNGESKDDQLAGEIMDRVVELIDDFGNVVERLSDWPIKKEGIRRVRVKEPSARLLGVNRNKIKDIEADENWKKDEFKMVEWMARKVLGGWLKKARFDKNNQPIVG